MQSSRLDDLALLSVSRACGFAGLGIFCFMVGLAGYPIIALTSGAILMMLAAAVLVVKAELSSRTPYKRTELWIIMEPHERPGPEVAQQLISNTLRGIFMRFAVYFARGGILSFLVALALRLAEGLAGN